MVTISLLELKMKRLTLILLAWISTIFSYGEEPFSENGGTTRSHSIKLICTEEESIILSLGYEEEKEESGDLHDKWVSHFLTNLLHQRLERTARLFEGVCIHDGNLSCAPSPHFVVQLPEKEGIDILTHLSILLYEVEQVKKFGFSDAELENVRDNFLRDYQFRERNTDLVDQIEFLQRSQKAIISVTAGEVARALLTTLDDQNRQVSLRYPKAHADFIPSEEDVGEVIDFILRICYQDVEDDEELYHHSKASQRSSGSDILLVDNTGSTPKSPSATADSFSQLPLHEWEKKVISKIITNMADKNLVQLAMIKKDMEKKGKRIHHVHPLRFMGFVCSNAYLKKCLRSFRKNSFKWDTFMDGFSKKMREEATKDNLLVYVPGFAKHVEGDPNKIAHLINHQDWEGLVKYLIEI